MAQANLAESEFAKLSQMLLQAHDESLKSLVHEGETNDFLQIYPDQ